MLVVDDEPQIVRGLKILLRSAGYTVDSAETKADALVELVSRPPDALVLDLVLPDGRGVEICEEVRRWSRLPILVLSAVGDEREKVRRSTPVRTTTSPSHSAPTNCWPGCARCCAGRSTSAAAQR